MICCTHLDVAVAGRAVKGAPGKDGVVVRHPRARRDHPQVICWGRGPSFLTPGIEEKDARGRTLVATNLLCTYRTRAHQFGLPISDRRHSSINRRVAATYLELCCLRAMERRKTRAPLDRAVNRSEPALPKPARPPIEEVSRG